MIDLIREGRRFRIVGDNINWKVDVHDQRLENKDKFHHAFGSAILVQNIEFDHLSNISPQRDFRTTPVHCFLPSEADMLETNVILISRVAFKFLPYFEHFKTVLQKDISKPCSFQLKEKTHVIPMPVLFKNEQYYQDVVHILEFYTNSIVEAYHQAGREVSEKTPIHIGGGPTYPRPLREA